MRNKQLFSLKMREYLAEGVGTFFLVFMGCGSIIVNELYPGNLGHTGVSMVFGGVVMIIIYSIGNISGAHLNPAVSFGFFLMKRIRFKVFYKYSVSQLTGAVLAALLLRILFPAHESLGATYANAGILPSFIFETILSLLLLFVILNVSTRHMEKGIMAGVAVGGTIMIGALIAGPLTGASMNPARSFAPAILSGNLESLWIYLTAPFFGAALACPLCRFIQSESSPDIKKGNSPKKAA